jgi:hypothetical protein
MEPCADCDAMSKWDCYLKYVTRKCNIKKYTLQTNCVDKMQTKEK